jgi:TPR repeat protein
MSDNCTCFQSKKELFQEYALIEMAKSPEYAGIEQQLESILLLADRILAAFQENLEFGRIWDIAQYLENTSVNIKDRDALNKSTEELLQAMERWFKPIISLALPAIWAAKKNDGRYTLNPVIDDLDILDGNELSKDVDQIHTIPDPARSLLLIAYRYRNPLVHNPKDFPRYVKERFLPAGLTSLLAPVYKYQKEIRQKLDSLITAPFESQETINLISMIGNERQRHLANFRGRQKWVSELKSRLESISSKPQPYLLLVGHEGMGKSALSAQITEAFSSTYMMGRHAGNVRKVAPWLPNTIIHFGKQSSQPQEIVHLLIAQINTLLLTPVKPTSPSEYKQITTADYRAPSSFSQYSRTQKLGEAHYGTYVAEVAHQDKYIIFQVEGTNLTQLRRDLYLALETAVRERGKVVLIIDAIDEISADGTGLEFLPDTLPVGVSALLTARPDIRVVTWLQNNRDVSKIRLTELERNEIPLFTGLQDELGETEAKFNDRLWRASKGWPLFVIEASKLIPEHHGRLDAIQVDKSMDNLFERQAKEWKSAPEQDGITTLPDLLSLLAIFEPVISLDMDLVQSFLERHNKQYSREKIKELLQIVSSQVEGMDTNRIKLALKSFAEYLRNRWYSRRDLQRALSEITEWLAKEQDIDAKFIALFLYFWTDTKRPREQREIASSLVESIVATKNGILLHQIYRALMEQDNSHFSSDSVAYRCLIAAAELEHTRAMLNLGTRLLDGDGFKKDSALGIKWLQQAAELGEADAMLTLGWRLLDGKGVEKDTESGDAWLLRAIECGDDDAKHIYANRLLDGVGLEVNAHKGEHLLLELADSGDQKATLNLATRYLKGGGLVQDIERGENLLRSLAAQEYLPARLILADMLISGAFIAPNPKEGGEILQNLSDQGNKDAAVSLSYKLMYGIGLTQDISKAHQILLNLATSGDMDAMVILGNLLFESDVLPNNVEEGKKWLVKAADENHHRAMVNLGLRFLDSDGLPRNTHEGKRWLSKAAELGDAQAMRIYGERLYNGDQLQKNINVGIEWLRKAADAGDEIAMILLSQKLLAGDKVAKDIPEGEYLLRKACDADRPEAWRILGNRLLSGEGLPQNLTEGEYYLRKAANAKYSPAMRDLGMNLFTGNNLSKNIAEAKQWLDKACGEAEIIAMQFVAQKLIEGDELIG